MNIDETTTRVLKEVKEKIKEKFPIELSDEEVLDIVDSQIRGTTFSLKKGVSVRLPLIGRFLFSDRKNTIARTAAFNKLRDKYSEIEFNQLELQAKIDTINRNKERWRKERVHKLNIVELVKMKDISGGRLVYDKLNAILEKHGEKGDTES